jgi:hypothetical protein
VHGPQLGPTLVVFHVQLTWHIWLAECAISDMHLPLPLPDFCTGLRTLEQNNNLSWVPSCVNVPQLQALFQVVHPMVAKHQAARAVPACGSSGGGSGGSGYRVGSGTPLSDVVTAGATPDTVVRVRVRNPSRQRKFTGSSALTVIVRTHHILEAIGLAGDPPTLTRGGHHQVNLCAVVRQRHVLWGVRP